MTDFREGELFGTPIPNQPQIGSFWIELIALGLTVTASATDAAIHKEDIWIWWDDINNFYWRYDMILWYYDIMKIVKSLEESDIFKKGVSETIKNKAKEQKGRFLSMVLITLGASLLGYLLTGKGTIRAGEDTIRAGEGTVRGGQVF